MDFELFKAIIDEAKHYGPRSFSLHLFGEPLLYPKILDAIRYIKEKNKRNTILLTTNGTLLNKFSNSLVALGVDRIIWSWKRNNFTPHTKQILRQIGIVRLLIEETPKEEFEKWSKFPMVEVKSLHNFGGNIDVSKWSLDDKKDLRNEVRYPCYHLWLAPAIRWDGEITICCNDPNGVASCGVYGELTLASFWKSEKLQQIRAQHLQGDYKGLCVGCNSYKTYGDIFFSFQKKNGHINSSFI